MAKSNKTSVPAPDSEAEWRAESDMRTLIEAKKVKADAKRYAAAQAIAKQRLADVAAVAGDD